MPATSSPEEQALDREYPHQHRRQQHHRRQQELVPEQAQFTFRDSNPIETELDNQQNQGSQSQQHYHHHQNSSRSHTVQSNTRLEVPSVPGVRSSSPSSSISALPTPSISPSASAVSIDAPYSSRDPSSPIQTPSSTSAEAHGSHPQRDSSEHNNSERDSADSYSYIRRGRNLPNMGNWSGQPAIRGNSEAMRMILLSFVTIGITYVYPASLCDMTNNQSIL